MTADEGGPDLDESATLATPTAPSDRSMSRGRARWVVFLGTAATVLVVDQLTKAWLTSQLAPGEAMAVIGDLLRFVHSQNSGALFGLFRDQAILFGIVSVGVVALIVGYHGRAGRNLYLSIALGLLLGGALGNLADRFRLNYVVDWIDAGIGDLRFWTFNVADAAVSTAVVMLLALAIFPGITRLVGDGPDA